MENLNSCCFVARINQIKPIQNADNIEQAIIGGWSCIIQKSEYFVGDLVIIATTDAVIPHKLFDAMEITNYLRKGGRVRTIKLKGVYSECLIIPAKYVSEISGKSNNFWQEGDDLMNLMKIYKYEPPAKQIQLSSGQKIRYKENPNFHAYYKFPNIKNVEGIFTNKDIVEITRKIHGTNARYAIVKKSKLTFFDKIKRLFGNKWCEYEFVVGSHNVEKGSDSQGFYDTNVWYEIADKYDIKKKLWNYVKSSAKPEIGSGVTIYGEIYGLGIQKGYDYGLKSIEFVGFDVKENEEYLTPADSRLLIRIILGLPYVEILHFGHWSQELQDKFTINNFIENTKIPHEGIVIKHHTGERGLVAKVINNDYLLYAEKNNIGDSH